MMGKKHPILESVAPALARIRLAELHALFSLMLNNFSPFWNHAVLKICLLEPSWYSAQLNNLSFSLIALCFRGLLWDPSQAPLLIVLLGFQFVNLAGSISSFEKPLVSSWNRSLSFLYEISWCILQSLILSLELWNGRAENFLKTSRIPFHLKWEKYTLRYGILIWKCE